MLKLNLLFQLYLFFQFCEYNLQELEEDHN